MTDIDLALSLLDHQLLDRDGRRCGKVDDLELEQIASAEPRVRAILVGSPAWRQRGFLPRLASAVTRGQLVRVPWHQVRTVRSAVELRATAKELRLGRADDRARPVVERIPGSSL
jgi:sporulation protein YlmC with PRC-barrel domain